MDEPRKHCLLTRGEFALRVARQFGFVLFRSPVRWNYFVSYALIVGAVFLLLTISSEKDGAHGSVYL